MSNHINATKEAIDQFSKRFKSDEPVVMLNLLKYKEVADYTDHPNLYPGKIISGKKPTTFI